MSPAPTPTSSSRAEATQAQGLKIQREIDAAEAKPANESKKEPRPMQAGAREYPTEFEPQHHAKPGLESEVRPAPMYEAPGYKGSEKLKGKVALITGGARSFAEAMAKAAPDRFTTNIRKAARTGKIFIDYLRNGEGASSVAAYSTRARKGAPIALPIDWKKLKTLKGGGEFHMKDAVKRLKKTRGAP
jgi:hypothetical protein